MSIFYYKRTITRLVVFYEASPKLSINPGVAHLNSGPIIPTVLTVIFIFRAKVHKLLVIKISELF